MSDSKGGLVLAGLIALAGGSFYLSRRTRQLGDVPGVARRVKPAVQEALQPIYDRLQRLYQQLDPEGYQAWTLARQPLPSDDADPEEFARIIAQFNRPPGGAPAPAMDPMTAALLQASGGLAPPGAGEVQPVREVRGPTVTPEEAALNISAQIRTKAKADARRMWHQYPHDANFGAMVAELFDRAFTSLANWGQVLGRVESERIYRANFDLELSALRSASPQPAPAPAAGAEVDPGNGPWAGSYMDVLRQRAQALLQRIGAGRGGLRLALRGGLQANIGLGNVGWMRLDDSPDGSNWWTNGVLAVDLRPGELLPARAQEHRLPSLSLATYQLLQVGVLPRPASWLVPLYPLELRRAGSMKQVVLVNSQGTRRINLQQQFIPLVYRRDDGITPMVDEARGADVVLGVDRDSKVISTIASVAD